MNIFPFHCGQRTCWKKKKKRTRKREREKSKGRVKEKMKKKLKTSIFLFPKPLGRNLNPKLNIEGGEIRVRVDGEVLRKRENPRRKELGMGLISLGLVFK